MKFLRRISKIILVLAWSFLLMPAAAVSMIGLPRWKKIRRGAAWTQFWSRGAARIAGVKTVVHGNIRQKKGMLLVSNHLGYLDILAHACNFQIRFTPNDGIKKWFFVGFLVGCNCPIWIDRKNRRKALEYAREFQETMDNGVSLLVYPEGTSTDGKHGMLPFKSTVFSSLPVDRPIQPMVIFYHETPDDCGSAAWGDDTPFGVHVWRVLGLKKVVIDLYLLPEVFALPGEDRKDLARRVREIMLTEYEKYV